MTLVQTEPKKIYIRVDEQGWQPGANTLAYWKLEGNYNDETGNYNGTGTNTSFVTDSTTGYNVMVCPGTGVNYMLVTTLPSTTTDQFTLLIRAKQNFTYEDYRNLFGTHTTPSGHGGTNNDGLRMATEGGSLFNISGYGFSVSLWEITNYVSTSELQNWGLYGYTFDRLTKECKFYYNGDYKGDHTYSIQPTTGWLDSFTLGQGYNRSDSNRAYKGWISHTILENKIRTAQEMTDYYNLTKGNYGL